MKFELNEHEVKKFTEWNDEHLPKCPRKYGDSFGSRLHFTFWPSGVGTSITVECMCGHKIDLTEDVDW